MQPILIIDLSTHQLSKYEIPETWQRDFLGGASLAARLLYNNLTKDLDPLSPAAPLLFLNGPLTGTAGPAVGRFVVCGRSPATGLWGESNCGGFWGPELRKAGYDGIWITGRADQPVYIWVKDDRVEIRPGIHLWGLNTYDAQSAIAGELGVKNARIAVIGPAGETHIPFALILTDHGRVAGRTGMGALMGSKNLKGIAVKGTGQVPVDDPELYRSLRTETNKQLREDPVSKVLRDLGTAGSADYFDYLGDMPKRYFQRSRFNQASQISGSSMAETILVGVSACHACVIACGRVVRLSEAESGKPGAKRKGPEYETIAGFGPNLWLSDLNDITRMGELCDLYGLDSISVSNTIGLAFSLFEKGIISEKDTGGVKLGFGNAEAVEALVHQIASRQGFGRHLSAGARALARRYGVEEEAVQVNGLEAAYHDPRGVSGMALVYATSPRGACHNQSDYFLADIGQVEESVGLQYFSRHAGAEKAGNVVYHQDWRTVFNALVMCYFANVAPEKVVALINATCGYDWTIADMMTAGERGWNLKRAINNRLGLTAANDKLPKQFLTPYEDGEGELEGHVPDFGSMLAAYYRARGWENNSGYPSRQKLIELGLDWVAEDLWQHQSH